jgi:hypothetical protein
MPFQLSPGVNVSEIDLTTIVPSVASTDGAIGGVFKWGPIEERVLISTEDELVATFGKPSANNFETFFTAANFLAYGNQLYVSRAANGAFNAVANVGYAAVDPGNPSVPVPAEILVKNEDDFNTQKPTFDTNTSNVMFVAKYAGDYGNSLKISICPNADSYEMSVNGIEGIANVDVLSGVTTSFLLNVGSKSANLTFVADNLGLSQVAAQQWRGSDSIFPHEVLLVGNTVTGTQYMKIASIGSVQDNGDDTAYITINFETTYNQRDDITAESYFQTGNTAQQITLFTKFWEYHDLVDGAPGVSNYVATRTSNTSIADEVHIVIVDEKGTITGIPKQILEVWPKVSRATDAKGEQGGSIYYRDVLNINSRYVWSAQDMLGSDVTNEDFAAGEYTTNQTLYFNSGVDGDDETNTSIASLARAYDKFRSAEDVDISLVMAGKARGNIGEVLANYIIDNICESRKDCVAFISPDLNDTVNVPGRELTNLVEFRNALRSTSYAVLDSGHKYMYDKYNDVYRWVPMNGDIAGLCARTDNIRDPWWSPAGFTRGNIKNIVKLAYNPDKSDRDVLYRNGINPVVNFKGQGTILYGDKTLLARPSAFDRINVRRLFIYLEKAIAKAAQSSLFEFNDEFTRASFRNLIEPYLRDVRGRRGIYDFKVVCNEQNNTPEVIDRNEFRGDIYIKPSRSINFIQLNFVAVRTGVEFDEIVGRF